MRSYPRPLVFLSGAVLAGAFFLAAPHLAGAAIPASVPAAVYGAVQVSSVAATKVPAASMATRYAIAIQNLGPNNIWCGYSSTVTAATGWRVVGGGGVYTADTGYSGSTDRNQLWCIAETATQVSPLDTRWQELR